MPATPSPSPSPSPVARRLLAAALAFALVATLLAAAAGPERFLAALARVPPGALALALALTAGNYALRFLKWQYYLARLGVVCPAGLSLRVFLAGMSMAITPGKLGEAAKSLLLKSELRVPVARTVPVTLAERLTDLVAIVALTLIGLSAHPEAKPFALAGALLLPAGIALLCTGAVPRLLARLMPRHAARVNTLFLSARVLLAPTPLLLMSALSVAAWFLECVGFLVVARAVGAPLPLAEATFAYAFSTLAGALSMLPGGLAATEGGLALLLVRGGADLASAGAAAFLIRALTLWFGVALGAAVLFGTFDLARARAALAPAHAGEEAERDSSRMNASANADRGPGPTAPAGFGAEPRSGCGT